MSEKQEATQPRGAFRCEPSFCKGMMERMIGGQDSECNCSELSEGAGQREGGWDWAEMMARMRTSCCGPERDRAPQ